MQGVGPHSRIRLEINTIKESSSQPQKKRLSHRPLRKQPPANNSKAHGGDSKFVSNSVEYPQRAPGCSIVGRLSVVHQQTSQENMENNSLSVNDSVETQDYLSIPKNVLLLQQPSDE